MSGYAKALEATGVTIKEFKFFGSYQGDWFAVTADGKIISGSYGSCSGCDAFQAEFDDEEPECKDGKYYKPSYFSDAAHRHSLKEYKRDKAKYLERLKSFGQSYVDGAETLEEIIARYKIKAKEWEDDKEIYNWLKSLRP